MRASRWSGSSGPTCFLFFSRLPVTVSPVHVESPLKKGGKEKTEKKEGGLVRRDTPRSGEFLTRSRYSFVCDAGFFWLCVLGRVLDTKILITAVCAMR